jgi:tetratricopeptide (TPR) repeat protein
VETFDKVLEHAPDNVYAHNNRGAALSRLGKLLVTLSRRDEAERAYAAAVEAFDEALRLAPNYIDAHMNNALTLLEWGAHMRSFVHRAVTRDRLEAAQAHAKHAVALAPESERAERILALIHHQLDTLDADSSQER